jgi:acyl-CoA synthetase (NDP forming)
VFATKSGAIAADVRIVVDFAPAPARFRPAHDDIVRDMNRIMKPDAVAVIGAVEREGKIGNSVMKNLINGGYKGKIYPINPSADEIMGMKAYKSVKDVPGRHRRRGVRDSRQVRRAGARRVRREEDPRRGADPVGLRRDRQRRGQKEIQDIGRKYGVRLMGPNIYGFYYTWKNLCATFCTAVRRQGPRRAVVAVRRHRHGDHRLLALGQDGRLRDRGLGNKSDIDEDDLLTFFEQDENTHIIVQHCEDLKDGRSFAEVAKRVSKKKPVVVLKAGRTSMGARAASLAHRCAGRQRQDLRRRAQAVRRHPRQGAARHAGNGARDPQAAHAQGRERADHHRRGGSGVLLSDACVLNGLNLMAMPPDLDAAFRKFIPPFGAAGNPVDITGGEPPKTYQNTVRLGLEDRASTR